MHDPLRIAVAAAPDVQPARRRVVEVVGDLGARLGDRVSLTLVSADAGDADVVLALAWNEADDAFEAHLARAADAPDACLLLRTDPPHVALDDREEVLRRLAARERLDAALARRADALRRVSYEHDVGPAAERELARAIEARTGLEVAALDARPRLDGTYVPRERLLRLLPDAPGHVVAIAAPYGSGKSVLAAQWTERLTAEGVRVAWVALGDGDDAVAPRLAAALGLAADTPLDWLRREAWRVPTLIVAEGLGPGTDLAPLLDDPTGFVLLASRVPLQGDGLARLATEGRVTRIGADDLAFTADEARALVPDAAAAERLRAATHGWALPLHVAALTGATAGAEDGALGTNPDGEPDAGPLVDGIRATLEDDAWRELAFLAAVPHLPLAAVRPATEALVEAGFVQALGNGVRVHPFLASALRRREPDAVAAAVAEHGPRAPLRIRGEAYLATGDAERLAGVLADAAHAEAWREAPARLVAWDAAAPGYPSPERDWAVGAAHGRLGAFDEAVRRMSAALDASAADPERSLAIARHLCVPLAVTDPEAGRDLLERAEAWIPHARPETAARFLGNAAIFHAMGGAYDRAVRTAERATPLYAPGSPHRVATEVNLALFAWNTDGDARARMHAQAATLERVAATYPVQALGQCRDLGVFHAWFGAWDEARAYLERAAAGAALNPAIAVEARATLAYLDGDRDAVGEHLRVASTFPNDDPADIVAMYAILLDLEAGDLDAARRSFDASPQGPFATCGHARTLAASGRTDAAVAALDAAASEDRVVRLYLAAARYEATRDPDDLRAFLDVTRDGVRLLPGFLPLASLPDDPALAAPYGIEEVLRSGRTRAIEARLDEVPPLRVDLLGRTEVRVLGRPVELTGRQRQLVAALALGLDRDRVAEAVWPDAEPKKQRNNLGVQLAGLRKLLEPWGVPTYLTDRGLRNVASDRDALVAALEAGDAAAVLAADRGPFAPNVDLPPVEEERARLRDAVVRVLLAAASDGRSGAPGAVDAHGDGIVEACLLRVLELEPLHEEALRRLLRSLIRRGRRSEAVARFRRFATRLLDETGLDPAPDTRAIVDAVA